MELHQYRPFMCLIAGFSLITICRRMLPAPDQDTESTLTMPLVGPYQLILPSNSSTVPSPFLLDTLGATDRQQLVDLHNFTFTLNDAAAICNSTTPLIVIALVHSAPGHHRHRSSIRETWGRNVNVVFLVGETDNVTQLQLEDENSRHRDIVQGSFQDSYRNLTYKHVMGLKWVSYYCPSARYIVKTDDDVFVNSKNLHEFLVMRLSPLGARRFIMCNLWEKTVVKRTYRSKWRVSPEEYAGRFYPGYCPGWAVIYSPDVVFLLYREAQRTPFFWIDDVHVTGTLVALANLSHTSLGDETYLWSAERSVMEKHETDFLFYLVEDEEFKSLQEVSNALPYS